MNQITIIYSDQDPFNPDPCVLRAEASPNESISEVMSTYSKEFHKIHFVFEGHPPIEQEEQEATARIAYASSVYRHAVRQDMQFRWRWYINTRTALMDNQISADKAHEATVCLMLRLFGVEPVEPKWYSTEQKPHDNAVCEVIIATSSTVHEVVMGVYNREVWRDCQTHQLIDVILWRYL